MTNKVGTMYEEKIVTLIKKGILEIGKDFKIYRKHVYKRNGKLKRIHKKLLERKNKFGYKWISIHIKTGKSTYVYVHRIIWYYYYGEIPKNLAINHKDGKKDNNNIENLELLTTQKNTQHAVAMGLINHKGENNQFAKLTEDDVKKIRELRSEGKMYKEIKITLHLNVHISSIAKAAKKRTWKHI